MKHHCYLDVPSQAINVGRDFTFLAEREIMQLPQLTVIKLFTCGTNSGHATLFWTVWLTQFVTSNFRGVLCEAKTQPSLSPRLSPSIGCRTCDTPQALCLGRAPLDAPLAN